MTEAARILLVDDDPTLLQATAGVLARHGFVVDCHGTARGALDALQREAFDLIVTDLQLPEQTGIELLRRAEEHGLGATAIVITGMPSVESAIDALRLAAVDYIVKPFHPLDLVERVRKGVETSRARRRVKEARRQTGEIVQMLDALRVVLDAPGAPEATTGVVPVPRAATSLRGLSQSDRAALSTRELQVLECMVEGKSPKEIASALFISQHTVRNHLRSIYSKLDVHSQIELVRRAVG